MEKYLHEDADRLEERLAACSNYKERQHLRSALRELKGLKLDGDAVVTYSFGSGTVKQPSSITSPTRENGVRKPNRFGETLETDGIDTNKAHTQRSSSTDGNNYYDTCKSINENIGDDQNELVVADEIRTKTSLGKKKNPSVQHNGSKESKKVNSENLNGYCPKEKPKFRSYLYAGSLSTLKATNNAIADSSAINTGSPKLHSNSANDDQDKQLNRPVTLQFVNPKSTPENVNSPSSVSNSVLSPRTRRLLPSPRPGSVSSPRPSSVSSPRPGSMSSPRPASVSSVRSGSSSPRKVRKISYRTVPFSPSSQLSPISSTVSRNRMKSERSGSDSVFEDIPQDKGQHSMTASPLINNMTVDTTKRNFSEGSVIASSRKDFSVNVNGNESPSSLADRRTKSWGSTNEHDMPQKKCSSLSRKNRVDSDSPRLYTKFRRKPTEDEPNSDSSNVPNAESKVCDIKKDENRLDSAKTPAQTPRTGPVRRKLPEIPVKTDNVFEENDETIHERTIRLLQERRRERLEKVNHEKEAQDKSKGEQPSITVVEEKVKKKEVVEKTECEQPDKKTVEGKVEKRSESKRKAYRLRREQQLLNRENKRKSPANRMLTSTPEDHDAENKQQTEKENIKKTKQHGQIIVRRAKSELIKRRSKHRSESPAVAVDQGGKVITNGADKAKAPMEIMNPEEKINLIGNLMLEEARLQEMLRKSTSFNDKRKMRSQVRHLRDQRMSLEGSADGNSIPVVQRCASVCSGVITPATYPSGQRVVGEQAEAQTETSSLEGLRRQLSETTDYDEKRKIRLALRQLRQQTRDAGVSQADVQRSQSFVHETSSQPVCNGDVQTSVPPIARSQSVIEQPLWHGTSIHSAGSSTYQKPSSSKHSSDSEDLKQLEKDSNNQRNSKSSANSDSWKQKDIRNSPYSNGADRFKEVSAGGEICDRGKVTKRHSFSTAPHTCSLLQKQRHSSASSAEENSGSSAGDNLSSRIIRLTRRYSDSSTWKHLVNGETKLKHAEAGSLPPQRRSSFADGHKSQFESLGRERKHSIDSLRDSGQWNVKPDSIIDAGVKVKAPLENGTTDSNDAASKNNTKNPTILISRGNIDKGSAVHSSLDKDTSKTCENIHSGRHKPLKPGHSSVKTGDSTIRKNRLTFKENTTQDDINISRLSPSLQWLANKRKSIPTPHDLDKLMSTMDIEAAFSEILDAVEHFPDAKEVSDVPTADVPIVEEDISESCVDVVDASKSCADDLNNNVALTDKDTNDDNGKDESVPNEITTDASNVKTKGDKHLGETDDNTNTSKETSAISPTAGNEKGRDQVELRNKLAFDSPLPTNGNDGAVSVIHGDDGTVTVQEVSKSEDGNTTITEWKRVRRTPSHSEVRETNKVVEKQITSPGGTTTTYEKDVSKSKRKITSRGSEYFSRNKLNIRKRRDEEGTEIVQHELSSVSENLSVSKNERWGDKSEVALTLNRDDESAITQAITDSKDVEPVQEPLRHTSTTPVGPISSGYGSVSGSEEESSDKTTMVEARPEQGQTTVVDPGETTVTEYHSGRPEITSFLQKSSAVEGSAATLECTVNSPLEPKISWYKGDNPVEEGERIRVHFCADSKKASLEFVSVCLEDAGEYKCLLENSQGTASTVTTLNVKSATVEMPSFLTELHDVSVSEGNSGLLECRVSSADSVTWYKDRVLQRHSPDFRQTFDGQHVKLEIQEMYLDDAGTYTCVLKNELGEKKCSCRVTVTESESHTDIVPTFLNKPQTQIVDEQDTVIIGCEIIGSPEPVITWHRGGAKISADDRHRMSYDGREARLIIHCVSLNDKGMIECVAENSSGKVAADCVLVVQVVQSAPVISQPLSDVTLVSGTSTILECCIKGDPTPEVSWRKNGRIVGQMFDFKQTYIDNVAKLEISKVCPQDSGNYECVATNDKGTVTTHCQMTVSAEPKVEESKTVAEEKVEVKEKEIHTSSVKKFPSRFVPKVDEDKINVSKSQASKIMLVRNASLRSVRPEKTALVRTGSLQSIERPQTESAKTESAKTESAKTEPAKTEPAKTEPAKAEPAKAVDKTEAVKDVNMSNTSNKGHGIAIKVTSEKTLDISDKKQGSAMKDSGKEIKGIKITETQPDTSSGKGIELATEEVKCKHAEENVSDDIVHNKHSIAINIIDTTKDTSEDVKSNAAKSRLDETVKLANSAQVSDVTSSKVVSDLNLMCSNGAVKDAKPAMKLKVGGDLRRTQSTRSAGSEKPEWLQVKLRKVGGGTPSPLANRDKVTATTQKPSNNVTAPAEPEKVVSVRREVTLSRSQSARIPDRQPSSALKDSTNTSSSKSSIKLTPVSERAKLFQRNEGSSVEKSSPTSVITKALNLNRSESQRVPSGGQRSFTVQRSQSYKTSPAGDVTLELSPQQTKGQENKGDSGSTRKVVKLWDPTAPATSSMDYSKIENEEELNKLLSNSDNFEERKKIRARIKEIREIHMKEWETKRLAREQEAEDLIKKRHREADLEKQKKLEAYKQQAAAPKEESKHLQVAEQALREKHRQADINKAKQLETFDRMARKEDLSQTSKVSTEVSKDGKTTTTTRKVETVTRVGGAGGTSYGKPAEEIAPTMMKQIINATSPSVSGKLTVKTESWSSKDGQTHSSEKTETWGAKKPAGNMFKQMDAANKTNPLVAYTFAKKAATTMRRNVVTIKQDILNFCQTNTAEYEKIEITNFSTSWNDGIAFCALIHHFYPEAFDFNALDPKHRRKNFELAFDTAEKYADIAPLLDVEDMVRMKKPDWKCVFTYVQSFYRKLRDHDMNKVKSEA